MFIRLKILLTKVLRESPLIGFKIYIYIYIMVVPKGIVVNYVKILMAVPSEPP